MIWIILGMFAVTYIPRMLPMVMVKDVAWPPLFEKWLQYVPYAALGALIFPGVLTVDVQYPWIGVIAALAAFVCSFFWNNMIIPLISSVLTLLLLQYLLY